MSAYLIVRAEVAEDAHDGFDHWYETEHLPDAYKAFGVTNAKRGWSTIDPNVHIAFYEFPTLEAAETLMASDTLKEFVAEFDRHWAGKVVRTREVVDFCQTIA